MIDCREEGPVTSTMEDYLEAVWEIASKKDVVRQKDICARMGVTAPTVNSAMKCLKKRNLIQQENYGYIKLTPEGEKIARNIQKRHSLLVKFLRDILGLQGDIAEEDACRLEHCASPSTMERLICFLDFVDSYSGKKPQWLQTFHKGLAD